MKGKRIFAIFLAAVLVMSLFAGCSKNSSEPGSTDNSGPSLVDKTTPAATTAKYAYQADYLDLQLPENIQYVNTMCTAGTTIFLTAYVQGDEIVQTDPDTGDTWSYYPQKLILLSVDPDTGACTQLPNLQLPTVPEDCEGNVDCYNMAGSDDGTLWMLVNVYAAKYDLPADFDPNTMNKYDYPSTDMSTAYLMHVAADGSTIANVDLSVTDDGTDEEDGMGSNISSFAVDAAGNLYVTDYNYIYVLDAEGKLLFKIDDSQYSGSLCRLQPDQVGIMWYNYATRILSGKQLMATTSFYSFEDYIYNIYPVKDKVTFVGYPSESGEPGNSFYIQCPMAISSVTKYPDAAWDFVSTMIRQTNEDAESMYAFPISQEAFDKKMTAVTTEQYQLDENGEQVDWDEDGEPDKMSIGSYEVVKNGESTWQEVYALTQEDVDQILSVINSATGIVDYDDEILSIVSDEVSAYFAGDKDVQTTANMIQSRVNLYVQEQR